VRSAAKSRRLPRMLGRRCKKPLGQMGVTAGARWGHIDWGAGEEGVAMTEGRQ
jgi:hypothetical protein